MYYIFAIFKIHIHIIVMYFIHISLNVNLNSILIYHITSMTTIINYFNFI
jgi:hypothetical protein